MAKTKKRTRAMALAGALVFFATSIGFSILVIIQLAKGDEAKNNPDTSQNQTNEPKEGQLQGTKLTNFTPFVTVDSLQIIDITPGTGDEAKAESTITAHYTGALTRDGTIFESSHDGANQPFTAPLQPGADGRGLIKGWQQGILGMKVGGTRRLIIPASLAYGEAGSPPAIGPNEPLVFDIELISIQ